MSRTVQSWVLVTMLVAAALLLVAELVDQDWLGAGVWAILIAICSAVLSRRDRTDSPRTD